MALVMIILILCSVTEWPAFDQAPEQDRLPNGIDALFFQYRLFMRDLLNRRCGFSPSCSGFGQQAIAEHGPVFGTMMALERWLRCNTAARGQDYYTYSGYVLSDPLEVHERLIVWDSLLLPF